MKKLLATDDSEFSDAAFEEIARRYRRWVDLFEQAGATTIHSDVSATSKSGRAHRAAATGAKP